jgi:DNA (cytosine-5)-methyltransferase 1
MLRVAHLFSGAGGDILAGLILGHEPVLAVEHSKFCCDVLRERKEDGWLPSTLEIVDGDIRTVDFSRWKGRVDQISAGFPCQDISVAGSRKGINGERSGLVWEVFRAIDAIQPPLVFLENSPNIRTKGRVEIIQELVSRGYAWRDGTLAASDVGAPHKRNRWWLLAANAYGLEKLRQVRLRIADWMRQFALHKTTPNTNCDDPGCIFRTKRVQQDESSCLSCAPPYTYLCGRNRRARNIEEQEGREEPADNATDSTGIKWRQDGAARNDNDREDARWQESDYRTGLCAEDTTDALRHRLQGAVRQGWLSETDAEAIEAAARYTSAFNWSQIDAGVCGVVHGLAHPMDGAPKTQRIKALGNGQVPLQSAAAWLILAGVFNEVPP